MLGNLTKARLLSRALENSGYFTVLSNIHRPKGQGTGTSATISSGTGTGKGEAKDQRQGQAGAGESVVDKAHEGVDAISNLAGQLAAKVGVSAPDGQGDAAAKAAKTKIGGKLKKAVGDFDEEDATYYNEGLPVVSFKFSDAVKKEYPDVKQAWVQEQLRSIGWIVPK